MRHFCPTYATVRFSYTFHTNLELQVSIAGVVYMHLSKISHAIITESEEAIKF